MEQEDRIQQDCVIWYSNTYCLLNNPNRSLIFHVPNQNQYKLIGIGVLAGVSDLIIVHKKPNEPKGIHLYIEVKTPTGKQSDKQVAFQQRIEALGYRYEVVRSKQQFVDLIISL